MAVVAGGSKMNLVETYAEGEDTGLYYGKNLWIAQTFTLDEETVVWRFLLKSWAVMGGRFYHYDLHETDGAGKPTGAPIAETTGSPQGEHWYSPGKWRRFDFSGFPKLAAGVYAIVASVPDAPHWKSYKLSANSTTSTYTRGKCWRSLDSGATWDEIANTDLMFQVWGYAPPPEPPPETVISNWAPYQLQYTPITDGYKIFFTTDNPCHLFMRWTLVPPQQHKIPRLRRGVYLFDDKRFCFVAWHENEQQEPGDTYVHSFIKTAWPVCQTRYFYFVGTRQAEQQPSTSPIFTKHRFEPPPPTQFEHYHNAHDSAAVLAGTVINAQTFTPQFNQVITKCSVLFLTDNSDFPPTTATMYAEICETVDNEPKGSVLASAYFVIDVPTGASDWKWWDFEIATPLLPKNTLYALRLRRLPYAVHWPYVWWAEKNGNPYPNGASLWSDNWGETWDYDPNYADCFFKTFGYPE